jgi:hypothetical protein
VKFEQQVRIFDGNEILETIAINHEGEAFVLHRDLPDGSGAELRAPYSFEYRVAGAQQIAAVKAARQKFDADLAHCQKLLRELPIALKNSQSASQALSSSLLDGSGGDMNELAVMTLEQARIQREIASQHLKEKERLDRGTPQYDKSQFATHRRWSSLKLYFDAQNQIGEKKYRLIRLPQPAAVRQGQKVFEMEVV